jgi:hypothetical protein
MPWRKIFFSILKTECIYRQKLKTFDEARQLIEEYIDFLQQLSWFYTTNL